MASPKQKIGQINFRLSHNERRDLQELADFLGVDKSDAHRLAVQTLRERLGFPRRDAVAVVEQIVRMHGDDAPVRVTIADITTGEARVSIAGKRAPDWTGWVFTALDPKTVEPLSSSSAHARHEPTGASFALGLIDEPRNGAQVEVRAADLPEFVVLRTEGKDAADLRRDFRRDVQLRRRLQDALDHQDGNAQAN